MLINVDAKALEWYAAVYLSQDKVGIEELTDGTVDQHTDNQQRLGLPSRLVAKIFLFRLIFGGSAFSYANDPDFSYISSDQRFWQFAIDKFYDKYRGLEQWHSSLMEEVQTTHRLVMPTGRIYTFEQFSKRGELFFPRTQILNYPVQGLGADLMTIARVFFGRNLSRRRELNSLVKLISTVHDSLLIDSPEECVDEVCKMLYNAWDKIPENFEKLFGCKFNLPMRCEIQVGPTWGTMEDYHAN
jgi:DNA polymerase I-like protein with 3'-5' exonuclease and polymerase domains